ncbi:UNVERIFIED_CONTAM: hypothetical protein FKN15_021441 [Acipenser sinensis]
MIAEEVDTIVDEAAKILISPSPKTLTTSKAVALIRIREDRTNTVNAGKNMSADFGKFDMNHWGLKHLKNQKVCVVVQCVRVKDEMKLIKTSSSKGSLKVKPWKATKMAVKAAGGGTRELLFQKDTVLACKAYGLSISSSGDFCVLLQAIRSLSQEEPGRLFRLTDQPCLQMAVKAAGGSTRELLFQKDTVLACKAYGLSISSSGDFLQSCYMVQAALENELREFSVLDQAERNEVLSLLSELLPYREALEALDSFVCAVLGQMEHTLMCTSNWIENYTEGSLSLVRELLASCGFNMCDEEPYLKFKDSSEQKPVLCALYAALWAISSLKTE